MTAKLLTTAKLLDMLKEKQGDRTNHVFAHDIGETDATLSNVYNQRRAPSKRIMDYLGLERVVHYQRKAEKEKQ